ncbi:MAG TPA: aldolase/citrate lyase family protein [Pseudolabrys sp.]|nr:aldolase/citrate lyase family protein [Pseudolabrys sp.]
MSDFISRIAAKRKLAAGELVLCMGLRQARTADIAMIAAACDFDAIYVDMEHSPISLESTSTVCCAALGAGILPIVRVPGHDVHMATRALDGGALGIIFPHVESGAQAERMVEACRFPPIGHRSVMGTGPAFGYGAIPLGEVNSRLNDATLMVLMLETPEGIANADAIAAVEGVDVLLIGSNDLCTEMGIPGQLRHPRLREAFETAAAACKKHGKTLGIGGVRGDLELQTELVRLGGNFIVAGSDVTYLTAAARTDAKALRGVAAKGV